MSTKCTIRHGDRWHLYQECFEDGGVYLNLDDVEVQLSSAIVGSNVTIRLDNKLALEIGLISEKEKPHKINWDNFGKNTKDFFDGKK